MPAELQPHILNAIAVALGILLGWLITWLVAKSRLSALLERHKAAEERANELGSRLVDQITSKEKLEAATLERSWRLPVVWREQLLI